MSIKQMIGLFAVAIFALHCGNGAKAKFEPPQPATTTRPATDILARVNKRIAQSDEISTIAARARLTVAGEGGAISANAQLSWYRDSILWVAVKKFGIEAARALVTKDSVYVLDRINKTCTVKSLASLQYEFGLPGQADFKMIGAVLLGLPTFFPEIDLKSEILENRHRLLGSNNRLMADYRVEEGSYLLKSEAFLQSALQRSIGLTFDQHLPLKNSDALFPHVRHIEAYSKESGKQEIEVEFSDVEVNTQPSAKFEIPSHYERIK